MAFKSPNYTQIPNDLLGDIEEGNEYISGMMADMGLAELKVTLAVCRITFGFQRKKGRASLTKIQTLTGLSRQGVLDGAEAAEKRGTIARHHSGRVTTWEAIVEEMVKPVDQSVNGQASRPIEPTEPPTPDGQVGRPVKSVDQSVMVKPVDQNGQASRPIETQMVKPVDQIGLASRPPSEKERERKRKERKKEKEMAADAAAHPVQEGKGDLPLHRQIFDALATVCAWDTELITEKQRGALNQSEKRLRTMRGQTVTPADVLAFGDWWKDHDWRGKQGEHPRPDQVRSEWGRFRYWQNQQAETRSARQEAVEYAERAREGERQAEAGPPELVAARQLWDDTLAELRLSMDRAGFYWLEKTRAIGRENGRLTVAVENADAKEWLENRLVGRVVEALKCASGGEVGAVEFVTC